MCVVAAFARCIQTSKKKLAKVLQKTEEDVLQYTYGLSGSFAHEWVINNLDPLPVSRI